MTPSERLDVGYDVTITRREHFDGMGIDREYIVKALRMSDAKTITRSFGWRCRARRFARSVRRLGKAFEQDAAWREGEVEKFAIGWTAAGWRQTNES